MLRLTVKNLWSYKKRLLTSALAVVLGVSFLTGTFVLTDSLKGVFDSLFSSVYKNTDAVVRGTQAFETDSGPEDSGRARVPQDVLDRIKAVDGVAAVSGSLTGYAQVIDKKNKLVGNGGAPTFGYSWIADRELNPYKIFSGRPPTADDEIVLDRGVVKKNKFALGDKIKVATEGPTTIYTLVGDATFGASDGALGSTSTFFSVAEAQRLYNSPAQFDEIGARAKPGVSSDELVKRIATIVPKDKFEVLSGKKVTELQQAILRKALGFFGTFLSAFAAIALFVSTFVIANAFSIVVTQRTREMAMMRAIGASRRQVLTSTLLESLFVGLFASIVGVLGGIGVATGLRALFSAFGGALPSGPLVVNPSTVIVGILVGTIVTVVSSLFPAIKASKVKPLAAIREVAIDRAGLSKVRLYFGLATSVLSVVALIFGLRGTGADGAKLVGLGAFLAIMAVVFVGPVIAKPIAGGLARPWFGYVVVFFGGLTVLAGVASLVLAISKGGPQIASGVINLAIAVVLGVYLVKTGLSSRDVSGQIARENTIRNPSRTSATALALTIGTALVAGLFVLSSSITKTFTGALEDAVKSDYLVTSSSQIGFSPEVAKKVAGVDGVKAISPFRSGRVKLGSGLFARTRTLGSLEPEAIGKLVDVGKVEGRLEDLTQPDSLAIAKKSAEENGYTLGQELSATFTTGQTATFKVVAFYENAEGVGTGNVYFLTSPTTFQKYVTAPLDAFIYVQSDGRATKDFRPAVDKAIADYPAAKLQTKKEFEDDALGQLSQILNFIFLLLGLAFIIAILGIANTLRLSIFERTREIGLLRAVGMSRDQLRSTIRWEAIVVSTLGAVIGLVIGVVFGTSLVHVLGKDGSLKTAFPGQQLVLVLILASIVGLYAARKPAKSASKMNILEAIATE